MSRTAKCRLAVNDPAPHQQITPLRPPATNVCCSQPFEATYKRKLEAVALLLEHRAERQIELRAKASLRTVQRWARRARGFGIGALRSRARNCQTSMLSDQRRVRLAADLKRPPISRIHTAKMDRCATNAVYPQKLRGGLKSASLSTH